SKNARRPSVEAELYADVQPLEATRDTMGNIAPAEGGQLTGRTPRDQIVVFDGPADLAGTFQKVKITKVGPFTLIGELARE
ncbi:MAG: TRAM domain-containing protein, partial [Thermoguttaceae bacterium]|nr:TRAM domain-containing protein [Thermoguttaceae bacterium]